MKSFLIAGCIVDDESQAWAIEDVTPTQIKEFLSNLEDGEDVTFEINSPGGSCTAGIAISNLIKKCSAEGHKTTAHVIGIAASIASVIACSCDELKIDSNAFLMIHNPWTCVEGNANDLRKEAETLDKFKQALVSTYKSKFDMSQMDIEKMMDAETWILGEQSDIYNLKCEVVPNEKQLKIAACILRKSFNNIPTKLKHLISDDIMSKKIKNKTEVKNQENSENPVKITKTTELTEKTEETEFKIPENPGSTENPENPDKTIDPEDPKDPMEQTESNKCTEEKEDPKSQDPDCPNEDDPEVLKIRIKELETEIEKLKEKLENKEEMVSKNECEKRVSGMQASMQKQINDFVNQLKVKNEELISSKNEITSLKNDLETSNSELSSIKSELEKTASALVDKTNKLDALNAGVLKKPDQVVDWRNLKGKEFWNYLKQHPEIKNAN